LILNSIILCGQTVKENRFIFPVSINCENSYAKISAFNSKKVIGIGESMYGSEEIKLTAFHYIKNLILNGRCKTVLIESPTVMSLKWDLYTQGIASDSLLPEILEEVKLGFASSAPYSDFFKWLREYNSSQKNKVRIFGIRGGLLSLTHLRDYFNILQQNGSSKDVYHEILENMHNPEKIVKILKGETAIKSDMGEANLNYLIYIINSTFDSYKAPESPELFKSPMKQIIDNILSHGNPVSVSDNKLSDTRDYKMWKNADTVISLFPGKKEQAVVFAHSSHVNKISLTDKLHNSKLLGDYMQEKYGKRYFCISIQAGTGNYTRYKDTDETTLVTDTLEYPEINSFERFGMESQFNCFYCAASALPKNINTVRLINKNPRYVLLKRRFDALVFIRRINPLQDIYEIKDLNFYKEFYKWR
jgi:erythromycin esterase-like protein